jgi:hypothetical protein
MELKATILSGPPLPPAIFIGSAITKLPDGRQLGQVGDILESRDIFLVENHVRAKSFDWP